MKNKFILLIVFGFLILLAPFYFFYQSYGRENRLMREGNNIIENIELFKTSHGKLPDRLNEIGFIDIEDRGADSLYYDKKGDIHYVIWFQNGGLGNSKTYYSDSRQWEDKIRRINNN